MSSSAPGKPAPPLDIAGIHRLRLPTPFSVGRVNAYLLEGRPLTLVDCGAATVDAYLMLADEFAARGLSLDDLELVILTHGHVDHAGMAATLRERHGVRVACLSPLAEYLEGWDDHAAAEDDYAAALMLRHGVAPEVVAALHATASPIRGLCAAVEIDLRLTDGQLITAGSRDLRVLHRPGHSRWDTVLVDEEAGVGLVGDHLLLHTSSNANMQRPDGGDGTRLRPLLDMRSSMIATRDLGLRVLLTGHGAEITHADVIIAKRLEQQITRAESIADLLRGQGPCDAHVLAKLLLGDRAITQAFLAISEVVGHLDLLLERESVIEHADAELCRFEARPAI